MNKAEKRLYEAQIVTQIYTHTSYLIEDEKNSLKWAREKKQIS